MNIKNKNKNLRQEVYRGKDFKSFMRLIDKTFIDRNKAFLFCVGCGGKK